MKTEDLIVNECGEGEVIEEVSEVFPHVCIAVFPEAFVVEAVDLGDLTGFVVTSEDGDSLWVSNLERNQKSDCLNRVVSSIDIVSCAFG